MLKTILNNKIGIINDIKTFKNETFNSYKTITLVNNTNLYDSNWDCDINGGGTSFDKKTSFITAIGESIERYCGNIIEDKIIYDSEVNLSKLQETFALNKFVEYGDNQFSLTNFPFIKYKEIHMNNWVIGIDLINKKNCYIPASLVWVDYLKIKNQEKYHYPHLSGLACGSNLDNAIISGILEVIERDITMKWWIGNNPAKLISIDYINEDLYFCNYQLSNIPVQTIASFLWDNDNLLCNVGFASRFTLDDAINKAKCEAIQLRDNSITMLKTDNNILHKYGASYRKDRKYKDLFRTDYRDMNNLMHNTIFYLDPRSIHLLDKFNIKNNILSIPIKSITHDLCSLLKWLKDNKYNVIYKDITTSDINKTYFKVVRVLITGMIPNSPTSFIPYGSFYKNNIKINNIIPLPHS